MKVTVDGKEYIVETIAATHEKVVLSLRRTHKMAREPAVADAFDIIIPAEVLAVITRST